MVNKGDDSLLGDVRIALLCGGVGGAKLADGLARLLPPENLSIIVNTGDDFQHLGLTICPDLDTVLYTLAGVANPETGWGRAGETWRAMESVAALGGPDWFRLGDSDLGLHLLRTALLQEGVPLTTVIGRLAERLGIGPAVLPMSDRPVPTMIATAAGVLPFQTWFVRERWQPVVTAVLLPDDARATPAAVRAVTRADLVIIAPSNPFVSIDPILNTFPLRETIADVPGAVVAVSPIVGGTAVKGPLAKMLIDRHEPVSPLTVANYYADLLDGFVYDERDEGAFRGRDTGPLLCLDTWMKSADQRRDLAAAVVEFGLGLL
jgi:LPPG:FO 2-phospho-L-lactate transferase